MSICHRFLKQTPNGCFPGSIVLLTMLSHEEDDSQGPARFYVVPNAASLT